MKIVPLGFNISTIDFYQAFSYCHIKLDQSQKKKQMMIFELILNMKAISGFDVSVHDQNRCHQTLIIKMLIKEKTFTNSIS